MNASQGFGGAVSVNLVLGFAILLRNGQYARAGQRFEGIRGSGMAHADAHGEIIASVD
jgi:hypothetical protein